ncbi:hypothetical protein ACMCNP_07345 [Candidatus Acidulodesulfobacterium sp. H_13]|uniref:hypothetical protein n=1 Tax=Candidatus Acidulodesulfobacterium sp. H_13 TaxID=3395470 RepID=UPI003AF74557
MKSGFKFVIVFNIDKTGIKTDKTNKIIYTKVSDKKKKERLVENLKRRATDENVKFNKRRLSSLFNPVFDGFILLSGGLKSTKLSEERLIDFSGLFFRKMEKDFGVNIVNYNLTHVKGVNLLHFEIFNYDFVSHKVVKSEFIKPKNVRKIGEFAETVMSGYNKVTEKSKKSSNKEKRAENTAIKAVKAGKNKKVVRGAEEFAVKPPEICKTVTESNMEEQVDLISLNWRLLSPAENVPVLEVGEPEEISRNDWVRIYFQKPNVRQVVWRFKQKKQAFSVLRPTLRAYEGDNMLWYEALDGLSGSRYIIFSGNFELSQTWVEIGYLDDKNEFIFRARSPIWPPDCLIKKLPELNLDTKRKIPKKIVLIGATENIHGSRTLPVDFTSSGVGINE